MSAKRIAALIVAALLAATLLLSGCVKPTIKPSSTVPRTLPGANIGTVPPTSVEPSTTTTLNASGPITTPASGSAERKALLDAARAKLSTSSQFYVHQLYAQGDTALGDLEPIANTAGRVFVAWEKVDGSWQAIAVMKFGSPSATAASVARSLPSFSSELISKINWTLPSTTSNSASSETSMKASLSTAAKAWAKTEMSGKGTPYKVTKAKVANDTKGVWWGYAVVQPSPDANNSYDPLQIWAKYSGGKWTGKIQHPEPPAPSTYFPSSVISKLGL